MDAVLDRLKQTDCYLVVLNSADADDPPSHKQVINLCGQTTFPESLAILRNAEGFWGVASSLCVAASQLFSCERLWVKGVEPWLFHNRYLYFCPHTRFPFLYRNLTDSTSVCREWDGLKDCLFIKLYRFDEDHLYIPGTVVAFPTDIADGLVADGQCLPFEVNRRE